MAMTGYKRPVDEYLGRGKVTPDGDNDRPYGRCIGQVCGASYPCTQSCPESRQGEEGD